MIAPKINLWSSPLFDCSTEKLSNLPQVTQLAGAELELVARVSGFQVCIQNHGAVLESDQMTLSRRVRECIQREREWKREVGLRLLYNVLEREGVVGREIGVWQIWRKEKRKR